MLLVASFSVQPRFSQAYDENSLKFLRKNIAGDILRFKRAIFTIGPAVIRGMKATTKLLRKAKQIPSGTKHMSAGDVTVEFRQFVKPGNYDTAMKDFFSVKPTGVQEFELPKQYKGLMGMIGDREISITDKDIIEGSPIMMILQTLPSGKHRIDRIIYHSE